MDSPNLAINTSRYMNSVDLHVAMHHDKMAETLTAHSSSLLLSTECASLDMILILIFFNAGSTKSSVVILLHVPLSWVQVIYLTEDLALEYIDNAELQIIFLSVVICTMHTSTVLYMFVMWSSNFYNAATSTISIT